jgi:hypothetical protein
MSLGTAGKVVFRWAAETLTGSPVNFSATLNEDGAIDLTYGTGNANLALVPTASGCGSGPTTGISDGRDLASQTIRLASPANFSLRWEPPFNYSSVPQVTLEAPVANATVQGVLTVGGLAYDSNSTVLRVDIFIDDIERAVVGPTIPRLDFCAQQSVQGFTRFACGPPIFARASPIPIPFPSR